MQGHPAKCPFTLSFYKLSFSIAGCPRGTNGACLPLCWSFLPKYRCTVNWKWKQLALWPMEICESYFNDVSCALKIHNILRFRHCEVTFSISRIKGESIIDPKPQAQALPVVWIHLSVAGSFARLPMPNLAKYIFERRRREAIIFDVSHFFGCGKPLISMPVTFPKWSKHERDRAYALRTTKDNLAMIFIHLLCFVPHAVFFE